MGLHHAQRIGQRRIRMDGQGVDDHAGFELLDLADFEGLFFWGQIFVNDADTTGLGHGDGKAGFRYRIHGGGQNWNAEIDGTRQPRRRDGFGGQHARCRRHQNNVVERERLADVHANS